MIKRLFPIFALFAVACSSGPKNAYVVTGKIDGEVPEMVYLKKVIDNKLEAIDSCTIEKGAFHFKGALTNPEMYFLTFSEGQNISFFLENEKINIAASIDSLDKALITGSKSQDIFKAFQLGQKVFDDGMQQAYAEMRDARQNGDAERAEKLNTKLDSLYEAGQVAAKTFVANNGSSVVAAYIIRRHLIHSLELAELENLTNSLNPELKTTVYVEQLLERINTLRSLEPGNPAPVFTQADTAGNMVSLESFKGNYLLIDFWASWCGPCRRANPFVLEIYKKFHDKGFNILGVSMDTDREKWLRAIADDQLLWTQVSTLEGWNNPAGKPYGVNSIPHAVLIDPDGKIVKRGITPEELEKTLAELLK